MKRIWSFVLCILLFVVLATIGIADSQAEVAPVFCKELDGVCFHNQILVSYPSDEADTAYCIPEGTVGVAADAFICAKQLEYLYIPGSCQYIGLETDFLDGETTSMALTGIENLKAFFVAEENLYFTSSDGVLFSKDMTILYQFPANKSVTNYVIPEGVTTVGAYAFAYTNVQNVTFPESLVEISPVAFYCSSITEVTFPENLQRLSQSSFEASLLEDVCFSEGLKTIEASAFQACGLTEVQLPSILEFIDSYAFFGNSISEDTIIVLPEGLEYIGDDIFQTGESSWETWTPTYAVYPNSEGYRWVQRNHYPFVVCNVSHQYENKED